MTNEKWWANASYLKNGSYDFDKIVAEAMRRGEVKAWSDATITLRGIKQKFRCAACDGASNLSHTLTCSAFAEIDAKLTSLKTP